MLDYSCANVSYPVTVLCDVVDGHYPGVLCFQNVVGFYVRVVNIIKYTPTRKLPHSVHRFSQYSQKIDRINVQISCVEFDPIWTILTYLLTHSLHGAESFLRSQLVLQLIKKFSAFYGTRKFITVLTSARHLSLSSANSIQSP